MKTESRSFSLVPNSNLNLSPVKESERAQLRLSLLALHRRVLLLGARGNFFILLALLFAAQLAITYLDYSISNCTIFVFIGLSFGLHKGYFIDLPATKSVLAFFEQNHPELCSWLPESALLEATMHYEKKAL